MILANGCTTFEGGVLSANRLAPNGRVGSPVGHTHVELIGAEEECMDSKVLAVQTVVVGIWRLHRHLCWPYFWDHCVGRIVAPCHASASDAPKTEDAYTVVD